MGTELTVVFQKLVLFFNLEWGKKKKKRWQAPQFTDLNRK